MATKLSQGNSRFFYCLKLAPLWQRSDPRQPNEKSAGAKESGVFLFICIAIILVSPALAQELTASWYSTSSLIKEGTYKYSKGVCANGELFKDTNLTCATRDFPLGVFVRVSLLDNSKMVIVKVTDRINKRFKGKRIDLSKRAFEVLSGGRLDKGLLQVNVERIK